MAKFHDLIEAQIDGATVRAAGLVSFAFKSGIRRLWQGAGPLQAAGFTWEGIGALGTIDSIQSGPRGAVEEMTMRLAGAEGLLDKIDTDADESVGRECNVYLQFFDVRKFDEAGNWVDWKAIDKLTTLFFGKMGPLSVSRQPSGTDSRVARVVSVTVQNALVNRRRPVFGFFSDQDQKGRHSATDDIFIKIAEFSEGTTRWPVFGSGVT